ncbi:GNAT family N-acetyltransferase [Dactylosporangium matsuzakiense]|uniref:Ribosomal-protein-alanine N-acetyltransferase n=1 Tax=Dactylosporangium matsuzakiense TaxID=53360 RepID=A0A9W6KM85_9ACTN|nr:GNAT family N-acetyltransferase [Dactylosporangium matsuzakiense]UWZ40871.1 GNAT family N-acetyltransferase [Dactylosporangium matsuzakiense]GLL03480.1 ribosomal-protein-alanine N-acetyltransferase [Dactylosporangium matsuzakiense]
MHTPVITRVAEWQWHALDDDLVIGRGDASARPDGRLFLSIDTWHDEVFEHLATTMLAALPRPLFTVVDEADRDLRTRWVQAGLTTRRREWEYVLAGGGLGRVQPPGVLALGTAAPEPLRRLDGVIRAEIEDTIGWDQMPAAVLSRPLNPADYVVATDGPGTYVGLARLARLPRCTRIGLLAVRQSHRRRGIGLALLGEIGRAGHDRGVPTVAEVHEDNTAAIALFEAAGAVRQNSNLELVIR